MDRFFKVVNKTKMIGVCITRQYYFSLAYLKFSSLIQCVACFLHVFGNLLVIPE